MNVLLIHLNPAGLTFQIGLAYIASMLEAKKHSVRFLFLSRLETDKLLAEITSNRIEVVFISVATDSFELSRNIVSLLKKKTKARIILGGIHPTIDPEGCIEVEGISGICIGEGEYPASEFVEALSCDDDYRHIRNLWIKEGVTVHKNEIRPLIKNLDELPPPNYQFFSKYYRNFKVLPVMLSRGCPFDCSYCCNHTLRKLYHNKGPYVRYHSVAYGIKLTASLIARFPTIEAIEFFDDTFTVNKQWLHSFLKEFVSFRIKYICNSRFDLLDEELIRLLADTGCIKVNAAVECGNERIRREVLRRDILNSEIVEKAGLLKKYKIDLFTHNMVGLPFETRQDILKTIEINKVIKPAAIQVSVFRPYPDSDLGNLCLQKKWVDTRLKTTSFHDFTVLKTPFVKPHIVDYYLISFESIVYEKGTGLFIKKILLWLLHFHHNSLYLALRRFKTKLTALKIPFLIT